MCCSSSIYLVYSYYMVDKIPPCLDMGVYGEMLGWMFPQAYSGGGKRFGGWWPSCDSLVLPSSLKSFTHSLSLKSLLTHLFQEGSQPIAQILIEKSYSFFSALSQ